MTKSHTRRFLILDDDAEHVLLLGEVVAQNSLPDHDVQLEVCTNPGYALDIVKNHRFDLIITDFWMPQMNGQDLIRCLRLSRNANSETPVLLISGSLPEEGVIAELQGLGGHQNLTEVLEKPYDTETLTALIERMTLTSRSMFRTG